MTRILAGLVAVTAITIATPASAQWRFDPRIDPSICHWQDVCDYGGRAYRAFRTYRVRHVVHVQR